MKAAGGDIDDVVLHTLRHTCITRLALGEMELRRLSMWAGHPDVSITAKRDSHRSAQALALAPAGGVDILGTAPTYGDSSDTLPETSARRNVSLTMPNVPAPARHGTIAINDGFLGSKWRRGWDSNPRYP